MALTRSQQQVAQLIMGLAAQRGLSPARGRELVSAAYAESGLNPNAVNKSSGAGGLFQLLSSGYVNKARQLGGVNDPRANTLAILPNYVSYWQQHPTALPGEAGRDVERSGMGADFYSRNLGLFGGVSPQGGAAPTMAPQGPLPPTAPGGMAPNVAAAIRSRLFQARLNDQTPDWMSIARLGRKQPTQKLPSVAAAQQVAATQPGKFHGLAEAFYDPLGSYDQGRFGGAIGGHSDHVHLSITTPNTMLAAIAKAQALGLRVGENPYVGGVAPVHVKDSFHYRDFPGQYGGKKLGEAIDVSGNPSQMAGYYRWATGSLR